MPLDALIESTARALAEAEGICADSHVSDGVWPAYPAWLDYADRAAERIEMEARDAA